MTVNLGQGDGDDDDDGGSVGVDVDAEQELSQELVNQVRSGCCRQLATKSTHLIINMAVMMSQTIKSSRFFLQMMVMFDSGILVIQINASYSVLM